MKCSDQVIQKFMWFALKLQKLFPQGSVHVMVHSYESH